MKKEYISPDFKMFSVNLGDVLAISNPRPPVPEVPETTVDEGIDEDL